MTEAETLRALAALAQTSRLQIFRQLVVMGALGMTPGRLSDALAIAPSALSFHLRELSAAGLISQQRDGRHLIYRAAFDTMNALLSYLSLNCCEWSPNVFSNPVTPRSVLMHQKVMNVLFICTHNSARSILAEALLNQLGGGRFRAYSAGSTPAGQVNPRAVTLLEKNRCRVGELRSKDWAEFAAPGAPQMDFVLTVCDKAAGEVCPVWPGQPLSAHWGVPDPASVSGTDQQIDAAFTDAFMVIQRRISLFLNLPIEKLERLSLLHELQAIGKVTHV